jgi:hypothetical protein
MASLVADARRRYAQRIAVARHDDASVNFFDTATTLTSPRAPHSGNSICMHQVERIAVESNIRTHDPRSCRHPSAHP